MKPLESQLMNAIERGDLNAVKHLVAIGASLEAVAEDEAGDSCLIHAVCYNRCDIVEFLCQRHANVQFTNKKGLTALQQAVLVAADTAIAGVLRRHGATLGSPLFDLAYQGKLSELMTTATSAIRDSNGNTLLHYAASGGSLLTVEWLVNEQHILLEQKDNNGATALLLAA